MQWLKDGLVARKGKEMAQQWQQVGLAVARLLQNEAELKALPPAAAWGVLNGLSTGLRGIERALRTARRHDVPPDARRALDELSLALADAVDLLEKYGVPAAEKMYGFPPAGTRWKMVTDEQGGDGA